jgi:uncharacterized membrane protein
LALAVVPRWRERFGWLLLATSFVGLAGAVLAADAGEALQETREVSHDHAQWGEVARNLSLLLFVVLAAWLLPLLLRRQLEARNLKFAVPKAVAVALTVLSPLAGGAATWAMVQAGDSGAKAVWNKGGRGQEGGGENGAGVSVTLAPPPPTR